VRALPAHHRPDFKSPSRCLARESWVSQLGKKTEGCRTLLFTRFAGPQNTPFSIPVTRIR
jgi:hypothetical protein